MEPETIVFMPNGDVTLVLTRNVFKKDNDLSSGLSKSSTTGAKPSPLRHSVNADDELSQRPSGIEAEAPPEVDEDVVWFAPDPPGGVDGPLYPPPPRASRGSDASSRRDRSASPPASFWAALRRSAVIVEEEEVVVEPAEEEPDEIVSSHEVRCVVSSRHLMLASEHFRTTLGGDSKEAKVLKSRGHVKIRLAIELETMVILLNIIHGASRKVPRQVTLNVLRQLAVLVSGFGMLETVEFFSDTWIDNLMRDELPKGYDKRVLSLMFVFWVFNRPTEFKDMTRLAQRESTEKLIEDVKDIPIARNIVDAIIKDREQAVLAAISFIHTLIDKYMVGKTLCDGSLDDELRYACDAMVLGSLMKGSRKIGIWPKPEAPFNGQTFQNLARSIRSIRILDVCNKSSSRRWTSHGPGANSHGLEQTIETEIKALETGLGGLKLAEYAMKSEDLQPEFHRLIGPSSVEDLEGQAPKEQAIQEQAIQEQVIQEQATQEQATQEQATQEQATQEQATQEQPILEEPIPEVTIEEHKVADQAIADATLADHHTVEQIFDDSDDDFQDSDEEDRHIDALLAETHIQPVLPTNGSSTRVNFARMEEIAEERGYGDYAVEAPQPPSRESFYKEPQIPSRRTSREVEKPLQDEVRKFLQQNLREAQPASRASLNGNSQEVKLDRPIPEQAKIMPRPESREFQTIDARISPKVRFQEGSVERPAQQETKPSQRQSLPDPRQLEARNSPSQYRASPKEEGRASRPQQRESQPEARILSILSNGQGPREDARPPQKSQPRESQSEARVSPSYNYREGPREDAKPIPRPQPREPQPEARILSTRSNGERPRENTSAPPMPQPRESQPDARGSPPSYSYREIPREEAKPIPRPQPRELQSEARISPPISHGHRTREEVKPTQKTQPKESQPEARISPTFNYREGSRKAAEAPTPIPHSSKAQPQARISPKGSFQVAFEEEMKAIAKEHIRESQNPVTRASPKGSFQESSAMETPIPQTTIPRKAIVTQNDPPQRERRSPPKDEIQPLMERKINRVPSYPNILRDEVNSPVHELHITPKLASIEEMVEKSSFPRKMEVKPVYSEEQDVKPPVVEMKSILKKVVDVIEEDELGWAPPKNFKIRKSKKTFSTRY